MRDALPPIQMGICPNPVTTAKTSSSYPPPNLIEKR